MLISIKGQISEELTEDEYEFLIDALMQCGISDVEINTKENS